MPYKSLTKRRKYFRELMRKRRGQNKLGITVKPCSSCSELKISLAKAQQKLHQLEQERITLTKHQTYEIYVDYALHGLVGIVCEQLPIRKAIEPKEIIH
jgi:hypothetical protein